MTTCDLAAKQAPNRGFDQIVQTAFHRWINFWFVPTDPAPLGLLRILVGGMLVYSHLVWGIDLPAFLGPDGWNSAEVIHEYQRGQWNNSFWWNIPVESIQVVHHWSTGILVLFAFGFCTRVTSVLAFAIHVSYCQRAALSIFGMDQVGSLLVLYLMIGPCGAAYSIDALIVRLWRRLRGQRTAIKIGDKNCSTVRRSMLAGLALRLIQVHYCIIYFFAGTRKLLGESWWTGEALWRAIANYEYQSIDMTWMAWFPFPEILQLLTHLAILWEISFAYLVWNKSLRPYVLAVGVLIHLGIGAFLGMWTFGLMMIFGYLGFVEPESVRSVLRWPLVMVRSRNESAQCEL